MYPSDYGYAAGNSCVTGTAPYNYNGGCMNKDWLWMTTSSDYTNGAEWLMLPRSDHSSAVFYVYSSGCFRNGSVNNGPFAARPVFYLTSSVSISEGEGTSAAPYILS